MSSLSKKTVFLPSSSTILYLDIILNIYVRLFNCIKNCVKNCIIWRIKENKNRIRIFLKYFFKSSFNFYDLRIAMTG